MTLNGHFSSKSENLSWARHLMGNGLTCSGFQTKLLGNLHFAELRIYCQLQKCSAVTLVSGHISFMRLFTGGSLKRECQAGDLESQVSHVLFTHSLMSRK